MKQVTITTGKVTIVVVDLPEGATNVLVRQNNNQSDGWYDIAEVSHMVNLPHGQWKHLANPSQLTEEDWEEIVDLHFMDGHRSYPLYRDYTHEDNSGIWLDTATESGLSLLKGNGVVMENPRGEMPEKCSCRTGQSMCFVECGLSLQYAKWREAEEQVWVNPHVFIKID